MNLKLMLILGLFVLPLGFAQAATLAVSASEAYKKGEVVWVDVSVSSTDISINAVGGELSYPREELELLEVEKSGSIIEFWAVTPESSKGYLDIEGVILNPGFIGEKGNVLTLKFKAKKSGKTNIKFNSAQVLANDGIGTNVLVLPVGIEPTF